MDKVCGTLPECLSHICRTDGSGVGHYRISSVSEYWKGIGIALMLPHRIADHFDEALLATAKPDLPATGNGPLRKTAVYNCRRLLIPAME